MATIKVTRLDHYPKDNPVSWAIGFTVETNNGRSFYRDVTVSYQEAGNDNLAIDLAYGKLQRKINQLVENYERQGSRVGSEYVVRTYTPPTTTTTITETPLANGGGEEETSTEETTE